MRQVKLSAFVQKADILSPLPEGEGFSEGEGPQGWSQLLFIIHGNSRFTRLHTVTALPLKLFYSQILSQLYLPTRSSIWALVVVLWHSCWHAAFHISVLLDWNCSALSRC